MKLYARWISRTSDAHKARCTLCLKDIDISSMGESALKSHAKSEKHKRLLDGGMKIKVSELLVPTNRMPVPSTQSSNRVENSSTSAVNGSSSASQPTENCETGIQRQLIAVQLGLTQLVVIHFLPKYCGL